MTLVEGLTRVEVPVDGALIHARVGGSGPALLLLHGYPQTGAMWHRVLPGLMADHTVVVPDLRGYGASRVLDGDLTFRAMARDQVSVMRHLGHDGFHVVAHDRGARAAHRLVLDHPGLVRSIALLDILPTLEVWARMDAALALSYYHWAFLAKGGGLPQRLIGADPVAFLHDSLTGLSGPLEIFDPRAHAAYEEAAALPSVVDAWCRDYAAGATTDREHDLLDRGRSVDLPALVLWGSKGVLATGDDPLEVWRALLPRVTGGSVEAGHFLVEERPQDVLAWVRPHLAAAEG
ncbi:alpha/beta fold hydrolase [Janibacter limosus]|uniref:alpha/beta fold hydrolase n=1 Tax=Janibacter limosus TaxID=53458 RepID=UPI00082E7F99|nr:alpha/beta hydrolase [Janibacter limosus]